MSYPDSRSLSAPQPEARPSPNRDRIFLRIQGIVQGVGFRPFVARLAEELGLTGHVENTSRGVEVEVQGDPATLRAFRDRLEGCAPPMARILRVEAHGIQPRVAEARFEIRASRVDPVASAIIPPDIATCLDCLAELFDPADQRHAYPFINCTNCGPRYTIIGSIPYDRARTSMAAFGLCLECASEYADPSNRRFHAQPNACPRCGPQLVARDPAGEKLAGDPIREAVRVLGAGGTVALLGLGGFHLACDAENEAAVARLRRRKNRPAKPLAIMVADAAAAREFVRLDEASEGLLTDARAPIALLPARPNAPVAPSVAPGQDRLGIFLPYTPLHHLLMRAGGFRSLVMTSGNRSDEPILATWEEARERLVGVADLFVIHDRPILHRVDDSVVKSADPLPPVVIRRARGYAPAPLALPNPEGRVVLAVGAELANTFCVVRADHAYLGPHVGDLKNLDVEEHFRTGIEHLLDLLQVTPDLVVCDLHPRYVSSRYAQEWAAQGVEVLRVQHQAAHAAGCMAEHGFERDALALTLDGLGHGPDATVWGGEIAALGPGRFDRVGHLSHVAQPGGDRAAREPWRMAASHLRRIFGARWAELPLPAFRDRDPQDLVVLDTLMARGVNAPLTSSCGRLFDAAAAILGFTGELLYSAQAPMELEALAARCRAPVEPYPHEDPTRQGDTVILDPASILRALLDDSLAGRDRGEAALAFHMGLARLLAVGAEEAALRTGLSDIFLSGGCLQNAVLARHLVAELSARRLRPHTHREIPPNDGGISFGQAAWALRFSGR